MRKALNSWYDPAADAIIADWDRQCVNKSQFIRDAVNEKLRRIQAAETREQETLDAILVAIADVRETMVRIEERMAEQ